MQRSELITVKYAELNRLIEQGAPLEARRAVVGAAKQAGLALPTAEIGNTVTAFGDILARPGVVLVGSIAFETYCGMRGLLGLPEALISTRDVDIACASQGDRGRMPRATAENDYMRAAGDDNVRVEFLTPQTRAQEMQGHLPLMAYIPILQSFALVLHGHFRLLLQEPRPATLFHDAGVKVTVPHPMRFAMHKLTVSSLRRHSEKQKKDREQAALILNEFCDEMKDRSDIAATFLTYDGGSLVPNIQGALEQIEPVLSARATKWLKAGIRQAHKKTA